MLKYNHVTADIFVKTCFSDNTSKSKLQFTLAQMFVIDFGYTHIFLMKSKVNVHHAMKHSFKNVGVPPAIISDFTGEKVQGEV